jgi:hypothetical protein
MSVVAINSSRGEFFCSSSREGEEAGAKPFPGFGLRSPSPIAWHEAAHCIVARFYGLPVAGVTIISSAHYGGRVWGPQADPDVSPEAQIEAAEHRCAQAVAHLPRAGEDPADGAPWLVHAASRCVELLAGSEGERLASINGAAPGLDQTTDRILAELYASTLCAPAAMPAYLEFARQQARAILEAYRRSPCGDS